MMMPIRTVVVASATDALRNALVRMLSRAELSLEAMLRDGRDVLAELAALHPDLLILDAHLPGMEGALVARAVLGEAGLPVRPKVLLIRAREYPLHGAEEIEEMGAVILDSPFEQADLDDAVRRLERTPLRFSQGLHVRAEQLLDELGVPVHPGRDCLKYAAMIASRDARMFGRLRSALYARVGEICGMRTEQAERAMRHAINAAWKSDKFENQYRIFADTVDAGRGEPTLSEMIARLADILRLEG